jgi:hypothetical protein
LTTGWRAVGGKEWRATDRLASFVVRPPTDGHSIQLLLDLENLAPDQRPRQLNILLGDKPIGEATIAPGRGVMRLLLPGAGEWEDPVVAEVSLRSASDQPLDLLLHSIRGADENAGGTTDSGIPTEASPPQIPARTRMRTIDLFKSPEPEDILVEGLSGLETNGENSWRWALGPATRLKFYVDPTLPEEARRLLLKFAFENGIPNQTVTVRLNGEDIRRFSSEEIGIQKAIGAEMALQAKTGMNLLEFVYSDWNHGKTDYGPNDPRKLAIAVKELSLQAAK